MYQNKKLRVKNWEKYQHYKKKNKNFNNEQPWFMFYGRKLLNDKRFMMLTPQQRDFLVVGCWAIGSQDNGFLPDVDQHAFWLRKEVKEVEAMCIFLLKEGWLEYWSVEDYDEIQTEQEEIIHENRIEHARENHWD
jgi:hypothetical protein